LSNKLGNWANEKVPYRRIPEFSKLQ